MRYLNRILILAIFIEVFPIAAMAVVERGIIIREAVIYVAPDASSAKLSNVKIGRAHV